MSNIVFPVLPGVSIERSRNPIWDSIVQKTAAGRVLGLTSQTYPRWKYKLTFEFLRSGAHQELEAIVGLFNRMRGRADTFLFFDEDDNATISQQIGVGDGATKSFQLLRGVGGFVEPIAEVQTIASLTVGGAVMNASLAECPDESPSLSLDFLSGTYMVWENDYAYAGGGRVVFNTAPAVGLPIVWSGTYYHRCRFDNDEISFDRFLWKLWKTKSVDFTTEKG